MSAESFKISGNEKFKEKDFEGAIADYTVAIIKNPNDPKYYTNRALSYLKLSNLQNVVGDSSKAIELDPLNTKANFYLGQAYLGLGGENNNNIERALKSLKTAYELAYQDPSISGPLTFEICQVFLKGKQAQWRIKDAKRRSDNLSLYAYLRGVVEEKEMDNSEERTKRICQLEALMENCSLEMDKRYEVPDAFVGKINFELMTDPIITPSGITFDRMEITEHLNKIGKFDPFTRQPLDFEQLIPNLALKETIDQFLEKNGWAVDY